MGLSTYDEYWLSGRHVTHEWKLEYFRQTLGPLLDKKCVLDYGCGLGYGYQRHLSQTVEKYIGADVSDIAIEDAKKKGLQAVKIDEEAKVELPDGSCDGVACCEVFEHLFDPLAAAKEIYRILKSEGVLVATVPNFGYLPWRLRAFLQARVPLEPESKENRYRGVHIRFFSRFLFEQLLRDAGFTDLRIYSYDNTSVWHVFWAAGPLSFIAPWAERKLPRWLHFGFLGRAWPSVFAQRLRIVARKF